MAHPIWKNYTLRWLLEDSVTFTITYEGTIIYEGKAYRRPNAQYLEITINDICADYIRVAFPPQFPAEGANNRPYLYDFTITAILESDGSQEVEQVQFFYDWSYNYSQGREASLLSAPILRKIPRTAPLLFTAKTEELPLQASVYFYNGAEFFVRSFTVESEADITIPLAEITAPFSRVEFLQTSYEVVDTCARYMLYYLNAFGGWDFLLCEGKDMQKDDYTRHTIGQAYNNDQSRNRGNRNYRNDITRKWQLRTLWIDDAGAQNMHHLLGSTDVYLYDLQTEQIQPILIDNPQCEYKTFSNNGNQLLRYDIEATLAQTITRR